MQSLAQRWSRAKYYLRRSREAPWPFLLQKGSIELNKQLGRGAVQRAGRRVGAFSRGYEKTLPTMLELADAIRTDVLVRVASLEIDAEQLVQHLAADFDRGRWQCLGYGYQPLVEGDWHRDGFHDHAWPSQAYFADIDYVSANVRCDVKVPWEKSRLQWLVRAALAARIDPKPDRANKRRARAIALLVDWLDTNPYCVGVNWAIAMEVAIRAINMAVAFILLADTLEPQLQQRVAVALGEHLDYLRRFPEISDVPGNHYLATEAGILFLEEFRQAPNPGPRREHFARVCARQFTAEGLHLEFSPTYHRLCLDLMLFPWALAKRVAPVALEGLEAKIKRAVRVCEHLANASGELPLLADNDSGLVIDLGQGVRRFGYIGSNEQMSPTPGQSLVAAIVGGLAGETFTVPSHAADHAVTTISPFVVLERNADKLVMVAGDFGMEGRASHDHDDRLSFWYSHAGVDVVVEAGCPPYTRDPAERLEGIVSTAHNVISKCDDIRFVPSRGSVCATLRDGPRAEVIEARDGPDSTSVSARLVSCDTEACRGAPLQHRRRATLHRSGELEIADELELEASTKFESRLHFPVGTSIDIAADRPVAVLRLSQGLEVEVVADATFPLAVRRENYRFFADYGKCEIAPRLVFSGAASATARLVTRLRIVAPTRD